MKYAIVGLGNPGTKYAETRHNVGFACLDYLAYEWHAPNFHDSSQANAQVTEVMVEGNKVLLVKPTTFMNNSGVAVRKLANYFSIAPEQILVIYDDVDLPLGSVKFATSRGSGGHRGVQSVINELGTKEFARVRVGITPPDETGAADKRVVTTAGKGINPFVMGQFSDEQKETIVDQFEDIQAALPQWLNGQTELVMNKLH